MTAPPITELASTEISPAEPVLTDSIRAGMLDLFQGVMKEERTPRRAEVKDAWRQRAFRNGNQQLYWDVGSYTWLGMEASGLELPPYRDVYNIFTPHWRSFVSLLSQNPPGINFVPDDLQQSNDVTAAGYAEKMRHRVDRLVHMKDRQAEAAGLFCTDGRTVTWSFVDRDGSLRCKVGGVLETKRPIYARKMEGCSYYVWSEERDKYEAQAEWADFPDEIEPTSDGSADANYERYARLNIIANKKGGGGYADSLKSVVTEHHAWFRPSRYRKASDETEKYLNQVFPEGVRMTVCGGVLVDQIPQRMEDALREDWPSAGQGGSRPSMLADLIPLQIAFNDYKNHLREQADYVDPLTVIDRGTVDDEGITEQVSMPDGMMGITPKSGQSVGDAVTRLQSNGMSPELIQACDTLVTLSEMVTGDYASLQGEGDPNAQTLGGQKLLTNQAKGQLSSAWGGLQWLFAGTYEILVRLAAQMSLDQPSIAVQGGNGQDSFSPGAILDGNFGCYPDTDSSFPETMADKRASLQSVLTQVGSVDPKFALHPNNLKLIKQYSGLSDLTIPGATARDKQLREIEEMLHEPPVPDETKMPQYMQAAAQSLQQGQQPPPPPMTASVPIDETYDYHQDEFDFLKEWLSSDARFDAEKQGLTQGIENIKLHGNLHQAVLQKQAAAAAQPQQVPMSISGAFKDLDSSTKVQVLQRDGYQPDLNAYAAADAQNAQSQAAETADTVASAQHKASQAQHVSVLAAKEAVEPAGGFANKQPQPAKGGESNGK